MTVNTATELAYKNGYERGYEAGKRDAVVHGRWIRTHNISPVWKCSECNGQVNVAFPIGYNYCPWCGTKMDLEVINGK